MFAAQAVVDAQGPDLEVGEDAMDPGQDDIGPLILPDLVDTDARLSSREEGV